MSSLSLQDQALRELGSTILNYHKFEATLKAVISQTNVFGLETELLKNLEKLQSSTSGQTLGALVNRLADTLYGPPKEMPKPDALKGPYYTHQYRITFDSEEKLAKHIEELKEVILSRNTLVHHTLDKLELDSDEACQSFIADLKQQNDKLMPFYKEFQQTLTASCPLEGLRTLEEDTQRLTKS